MIDQIDHLWIAKGKKLLGFDLSEAKPDKTELAQHLIGRSGNLRAPTLIRGKDMFVGFHPDGMKEFLQN